MLDIISQQNRTKEFPEKNMWRAVFLQALREALCFDERAAYWLLADMKDAPRVLSFADIEADYVRPRLAK